MIDNITVNSGTYRCEHQPITNRLLVKRIKGRAQKAQDIRRAWEKMARDRAVNEATGNAPGLIRQGILHPGEVEFIPDDKTQPTITLSVPFVRELEVLP